MNTGTILQKDLMDIVEVAESRRVVSKPYKISLTDREEILKIECVWIQHSIKNVLFVWISEQKGAFQEFK